MNDGPVIIPPERVAAYNEQRRRDSFAGLAMQSLLLMHPSAAHAHIAGAAWEMADKMMVARDVDAKIRADR